MRHFALLALSAAIPLAACSGGNASTGVTGNKTFALDGFTAIETTGPDAVDVRVGPAFSVRAEGDTGILQRLEVVRNGDTLEIRRKSHSGFSWGGGERGRLKIYVTMPRIGSASATGSGDLTIDRVAGGDFSADATGSGDVAIGSLDVQALSIAITGSGNVTAAGTAKTAKLSVTGSGDIAAAKLSAASAEVNVMGSGNIAATVPGPAKVDVMGSGDVTLTGGAKCQTSKMGSGSITCS